MIWAKKSLLCLENNIALCNLNKSYLLIVDFLNPILQNQTWNFISEVKYLLMSD